MSEVNQYIARPAAEEDERSEGEISESESMMVEALANNINNAERESSKDMYKDTDSNHIAVPSFSGPLADAPPPSTNDIQGGSEQSAIRRGPNRVLNTLRQLCGGTPDSSSEIEPAAPKLQDPTAVKSSTGNSANFDVSLNQQLIKKAKEAEDRVEILEQENASLRAALGLKRNGDDIESDLHKPTKMQKTSEDADSQHNLYSDSPIDLTSFAGRLQVPGLPRLLPGPFKIHGTFIKDGMTPVNTAAGPTIKIEISTGVIEQMLRLPQGDQAGNAGVTYDVDNINSLGPGFLNDFYKCATVAKAAADDAIRQRDHSDLTTDISTNSKLFETSRFFWKTTPFMKKNIFPNNKHFVSTKSGTMELKLRGYHVQFQIGDWGYANVLFTYEGKGKENEPAFVRDGLVRVVNRQGWKSADGFDQTDVLFAEGAKIPHDCYLSTNLEPFHMKTAMAEGQGAFPRSELIKIREMMIQRANFVLSHLEHKWPLKVTEEEKKTIIKPMREMKKERRNYRMNSYVSIAERIEPH